MLEFFYQWQHPSLKRRYASVASDYEVFSCKKHLDKKCHYYSNRDPSLTLRMTVEGKCCAIDSLRFAEDRHSGSKYPFAELVEANMLIPPAPFDRLRERPFPKGMLRDRRAQGATFSSKKLRAARHGRDEFALQG